MGFFSPKACVGCKKTVDVKRCPFCKKDLCEYCLKYIVMKDETPAPLVGKEVMNLRDLTAVYKEYQKKFTDKKIHVHLCDEFLSQVWSGIKKQVKSFEKGTEQKMSKITLR